MDKKPLIRCCPLVVLLALSIQLVRCGDESKGSHDELKNNTQQSDMTPTPTESQAPTRRGFRFPNLPDFTRFKKKFNKHYGSLVEEMARLKLFLARLFRAKSSMIAYSSGHSGIFLRVNFYSDRTDEEREMAIGSVTEARKSHSKENHNSEKVTKSREKRGIGIKGIYKSIKRSMSGNNRHTHHRNPSYRYGGDSDEDEPTENHILDNESGISVDLRKLGCFTRPKRQLICGSCYAFAAVAQFEFMYCLIYGKRIHFSEQYPMDCGGKYELNGCQGGHYKGMYHFAYVWGMETAEKYEYLGRNGICKHDRPKGLFETSTKDFIGTYKSGWKYWLKQKVPLYIEFNPTFNPFLEYGGGIDFPECGPIRHAMVLVGVGSNSYGTYYILRNSLGEDWGYSGYYYVYEDSPCFVDVAYLPEDLDTPNKESFFKNNERDDVDIPEFGRETHSYTEDPPANPIYNIGHRNPYGNDPSSFPSNPVPFLPQQPSYPHPAPISHQPLSSDPYPTPVAYDPWPSDSYPTPSSYDPWPSDSYPNPSSYNSWFSDPYTNPSSYDSSDPYPPPVSYDPWLSDTSYPHPPHESYWPHQIFPSYGAYRATNPNPEPSRSLSITTRKPKHKNKPKKSEINGN